MRTFFTKTTLTERGRTTVPVKIRKRFGIRAGQKLEWAEDGKVIYLALVSRNPIQVFRKSSGDSNLTKMLLRERKIDAVHS